MIKSSASIFLRQYFLYKNLENAELLILDLFKFGGSKINQAILSIGKRIKSLRFEY